MSDESTNGQQGDLPPQTRREAREASQAGQRSQVGQRSQAGQRSQPSPSPRRRRRWIGWLIAVVAIVAVFGGTAGFVWVNYEPQVRKMMGWELSIDYTGNGNGSVVVTITNGQIGSDVAASLHKAGVTMTTEAFYKLLLTRPEVQFHPGSYQLKKKMSAQAALDALLDHANKVQTRIGFPEGSTVATVLAKLADLSESTGIELPALQAAAADVASFGLPQGATSLEGYLFPATYSLDPGMSAHDILQRMVTEMSKRLDTAGVSAPDRNRTLTIASLIQREAGSNPDDFYKVSRVIQNRLDQGMLLQFDSTAHYGYEWKHGARPEGGVFSTSAELKDDNPYNTYVHTGLPVGPIGAPGQLAIDAALNPVAGTWLYFVTVNLDTGETKFTSTLADHNAAVKQLQDWCKTSKSKNCG